ncbi:MAG: hypothetical protein KAQ92_05380 [Candidatus Aenigmarchaeota archaeon]|nr:hypothetical protein [Candidatus Aenigmarchaeota archaeon]
MAAPDRNPTEFCWKRTRELFTSLISFDSIEQMTEGLGDFWEKHVFTHNVSHYLGL